MLLALRISGGTYRGTLRAPDRTRVTKGLAIRIAATAQTNAHFMFMTVSQSLPVNVSCGWFHAPKNSQSQE